jgi:hypothetical protein
MRRCGWCGVMLRWYQINFCRVCAFHLRYDMSSPPCEQASRWNSAPDHFVAPKHPERR